MEDYILTQSRIDSYLQYLCSEEHAKATIEKYLRDIRVLICAICTPLYSIEPHGTLSNWQMYWGTALSIPHVSIY